jgi:hypothetical protein
MRGYFVSFVIYQLVPRGICRHLGKINMLMYFIYFIDLDSINLKNQFLLVLYINYIVAE